MDSTTIIVLGYNSKAYLQDCFASLQAMDGAAKARLLFVDNASQDGSVSWMKEHFPEVEILRNPANLGFCGGNNAGARHARTEWIGFLNPDMRVAPDWLAQFALVAQDPTVDAVASRIMNWDGSLVDFGGSAMNFYGYGMQEGIGEAPPPSALEDRDVLFACGGAMFVRRDLFLEAGGFDEDYFAFFEDMDLGWRLWVLGYRVRYAARMVVYHHHHGSWGQVPRRERQTLYERNTLASVLKNYEDATLAKVLPAALLLSGYRAFLTSGLDPDAYRPRPPAAMSRAWGPYAWVRDAVLYYGPRAWAAFRDGGPAAVVRKGRAELERRAKGRRQSGQAPLPADGEPLDPSATYLPDRTMAYLDASRWLLASSDGLMAKRQRIQAARRRSDREVQALFRKPLTPNYPDPEHLRAMMVLCEIWSIYDLFREH
ncbi:MAG: glycosyltransferase family 2 protein [Anaerolineaceae bacterium]|nr:glycosyltransferase family 2 protein [Anaerolineaceae bacterium]